MPNEIDELMDLDPTLLSAQNIDSIIAYHRKARASHEAGVKPKKGGGEKVSLDSVVKALAPPAATAGIRRRV